MDCPICRDPMTAGELSLESTFIGSLTAGASSYLELFFRRQGEKRLSVMTPSDTPAAFNCSRCGTVILCGLHGTDTECLACGGLMAPGVTICPQCGWTYDHPVQ